MTIKQSVTQSFHMQLSMVTFFEIQNKQNPPSPPPPRKARIYLVFIMLLSLEYGLGAVLLGNRQDQSLSYSMSEDISNF